MKWYKMYTKSMQDIKFKKLARSTMIDFPLYWTAWCVLLDVTAENEGSVKYWQEDDLEIIFEMLQVQLPTIRVILEDMESVGLIERKTNEITVRNWEKYQSAQFHSTERVRKHRENKEQEELVDAIIKEFNAATGKSFSKKTDETRKLIRGRLNDGRTREELMAVVHWKQKSWAKDDKMSKFIRPNTLFRPGNFDSYLNEIPPDLLKATVDGTLLKVRDMYGTIKNVTQAEFEKAEEGFYEIIK